ncbi:hypothetical protein BDR03DRAFT_1005057 [Suillus americanus]|nr:hypothetical protein BDR03DRAFT_1005057 [Suillus americanus]
MSPHPPSNSVAIVSDDPTWWPAFNSYQIFGYFVVAASVGVVYDWALTFGQEVELVWIVSVVLGPRLILGGEYYAKLMADSDVATGMTSIAFQERVDISTGSGV